ncbi:MAG: hypothetical protein Q8P57_03755 [Candidatus Pacearchaeota archaeon]|nr:hypothetical protein [Candidatus Pacearchaeota archaeon]
MFGGKKGVSAVIGTVFIILLVFIAVSGLVIYLNKSSESVEGGLITDCFTLSLEPVKCESYGYCDYRSGVNSWESEVLVKRNLGEGDLSGVRFLFKENTILGTQKIDFSDVDSFGLNELETKNFKEYPYRVKVPAGINPEEVSVVALTGNSKESCNFESDSVLCNLGVGGNPPRLGFEPGNTKYENYCCQYPWNLTTCSPDDVSSGKVYCCSKVPGEPGTSCSVETCCLNSESCY